MSILNADIRGEPKANPSYATRPLFTTLIKCDLYDAGYVGFTRRHASTSTCSRTQKIDSIDWQAFSQQALFGLEGSYEEF